MRPSATRRCQLSTTASTPSTGWQSRWSSAKGTPYADPATDEGRVLASRVWRAQSWAVDGILKSVALTVKSSIAAASKMASSSPGWHRHAVPWPDPANLGVFDLFTVQINSHILFTRIRFHLGAVSYTHLRAHETRHDLVCRLLLEKKKK